MRVGKGGLRYGSADQNSGGRTEVPEVPCGQARAPGGLVDDGDVPRAVLLLGALGGRAPLGHTTAGVGLLTPPPPIRVGSRVTIGFAMDPSNFIRVSPFPLFSRNLGS